MSEEDTELERLKAKRLAEMQKNIATQQEIEKTQELVKEKPLENPRDLLVNRLGFRGLEVLENAESQFPNEAKIIIEKLSELIKTGEISEILDGGKLLALFRSVGLSVRMETKIHIEQDGKFVSLSDKLRDKSSVDK
ncbi:MAG: double-stranded DNA-binding protein [Thaumarchaeota archaeon]|nr:double-stranded DNA-binding protein [Nitrososphaerota archaeon]